MRIMSPLLQQRVEGARAVEPRAVAAFQIFDRISLGAAIDADVMAGDAEVGEGDLVVALTADQILGLGERKHQAASRRRW